MRLSTCLAHWESGPCRKWAVQKSSPYREVAHIERKWAHTRVGEAPLPPASIACRSCSKMRLGSAPSPSTLSLTHRQFSLPHVQDETLHSDDAYRGGHGVSGRNQRRGLRWADEKTDDDHIDTILMSWDSLVQGCRGVRVRRAAGEDGHHLTPAQRGHTKVQTNRVRHLQSVFSLRAPWMSL